MMMRLVLLMCLCGLVRSSDVVVLDGSNFDSVVDGSKHVLVEFYAPWCGHCKNLAPVYEQVATAFASSSDVVVAKVDADAHRELGTKYDVSGFPTIKFFPKGSTKATAYEKGRSAKDFVDFLNGKAGSNYRIIKPPTDVVELTASTFESIVLDPTKNVFVEFYAPWCGHCKTLQPVWAKLANIYAGDVDDIVIAALDAAEHKELATKFDVSGFPTLKFFGKGAEKKPVEYTTDKSLHNLVEYVNEHAGTSRVSDGSLKPDAGRLNVIDALLKENQGQVSAEMISKVEEILEKLAPGSEMKMGNLYLKAMKKIMKKNDYVSTELKRLSGMIKSNAVSAAKKKLFYLRKNILQSFQSAASDDDDNEKEEL